MDYMTMRPYSDGQWVFDPQLKEFRRWKIGDTGQRHTPVTLRLRDAVRKKVPPTQPPIRP